MLFLFGLSFLSKEKHIVINNIKVNGAHVLGIEDITQIAKKYNIIFVMLSQFARTSQYSEKGKTREPMLYDLKSTGDLEASGDLIILLWRPVLNTPNLSEIDREAQKYLSYIKIAKSRRGIRGDQYFELTYDPNTSRLKEKTNA